jgi:TIR domain
MRVFISHSWKNKIEAQKIYNALKELGVGVWLDAKDLLPGQVIQSTIDRELESIDIMILVWSEQAMNSTGVKEEIETAAQLQKIIIPCKLGNFSLRNHAYLKDIKGIDFASLDDGIGRLKMAIVNYMAQKLDLHGESGIQSMNEFLGALETSWHLAKKENIKEKGTEEEKTFWVDHIQKTQADAHQKLSAQYDVMNEIKSYLEEKMKQLENAMNDPRTYNSILNEIRNSKYGSNSFVQHFLESAEKIHPPAVIQEQSPSNKDNQLNIIHEYRAGIQAKTSSSYSQVKQWFGGLLPDFLFRPTFDNLCYLYTSSADNLELLYEVSLLPEAHPIVEQTVQALTEYLSDPGGVIADNYSGILGYTDDAWLIHLEITYLNQFGAINIDAFQTDWDKVNGAANTLFALLGQNTRTQIEDIARNVYDSMAAPYLEQRTPTYDDLQKAKDDLWKGKLIGLQGDLLYGHNPIW